MSDETTPQNEESTPQNEEANLLKSFAESTGDVPLLNRPKSGLSRDFPLTGYRDQTDDNGKSNKDAAIEFLASIDSIPKDEEGKFDVRLLNEISVEPGSAAPLEMFRRGLLEMGTDSFLHNTYPEWLGDATDDANADLDAIQYIHHLKEYGYEKLNDDLNAKPAPNPEYPDDDEDDWEYPEDNILSMTFSSITNELFTLMRGRKATAEEAIAAQAERERWYNETHQKLVDWARETHGLELHHSPSEMQGYATPFYTTPDELEGYIMWDNTPGHIVMKKTRPNTETSWFDDSVTVTPYHFGLGTDPSTYPTEQPRS